MDELSRDHNEVSTMKTIRACPTCGDREAELLTRQRFEAPRELNAPHEVDIVSCLGCGTGFSDLGATQADLDEAYRDHSKYADTSLYAGDEEQVDRPPTDAPWDLQRLQGTAQWLAGVVPVGARVLDAGCATGALLGFLLEAGFTDLVGLDPSPIATAAAHRGYGVPTVTGSFMQPPDGIGTFDVIVLSHVLEHLADVSAAIDGMYQMTRPGGLVYIEVPDAARYGDYLVAPYHDFNTEHINHHSANTLALAMEIGGFETVTVEQKTVLCSPSDPYPAVFGLFRRPDVARQPPPVRRDLTIGAALRQYVRASERLLEQMSEHIRRQIGDGPVVLWGAGQLAIKLLSGPLRDIGVTALVDSSSAKWGHRYGWIDVIGPDRLTDDGTPILITSVHHARSIRQGIESRFPDRQIIELR